MKVCNMCGVDLVPNVNQTPGVVRAGINRCKSCVSKKTRQWAIANPDNHRECAKNWGARNRKYQAAQSAKRRALQKAQMPSWFCADTVNAIYEGCPEGYHVDHIVPLAKGGLHSHENLQYLTVEENQRKNDSDCWISWEEQ